MHEEQRVGEMVSEVLGRQARAHSRRTGATPAEAAEAVLGTEAGQLLGELREGSSKHELAKRWQTDLPRQRLAQQDRARREEQDAQRALTRAVERERASSEAWRSFMRTERREMKLRQGGQLASALGEALPGESRDALRRLAAQDRRQADEGLVALMSDGRLTYKRLEELCAADMAARGAANRLRMTWLKERQDAWLASDLD